MLVFERERESACVFVCVKERDVDFKTWMEHKGNLILETL